MRTEASEECEERGSTVQTPPAVLVVALLGEAVVPQHLVGRMPEFGQGLGGAAVAS